MDVDPPLPHPVLKRCSSAPMINQECEQEAGAVASPATATSASTAPSPSSRYFISFCFY